MKPAQTPHIRPRVRSRTQKDLDATSDSIDQILVETQRRLDVMLKTANYEEPIPAIAFPPTSSTLHQCSSDELSSKPSGILKTSKYTKPSTMTTSTQARGSSNQVCQGDDDASGATAESKRSEIFYECPASYPLMVKDNVIERDPAEVYKSGMITPTVQNPIAVEGYVPKLDIPSVELGKNIKSKAKRKEDRDLEESAESHQFETDLEFSVLSKQEFDELIADDMEGRLEQPIDAFRGRFDIFASDGDDDDPVFSGCASDDDNSLWSDHDDELEETIPPEPRAFIKLWETLSGWVTPEAVALIKDWTVGETVEVSPNWVPVVDTSEIAASRCAGLMALLNMHFPRCWKELGYSNEMEKVVKHRVADLLRAFNYSRPTARLDTALWRAMTNVLICMVLPTKDYELTTFAPAAKSVGLSIEEYVYLTKSCFVCLEAGS